MKNYGFNFDSMIGGYKVPFNPLPVLQKIESDPFNIQAWDEIWENLYHQDDVGDASYASVILLTDIFSNLERTDNYYGLVCAIDVARHNKANPALPAWLKNDYLGAIEKAGSFAKLDLGSSSGITLKLLLATIAASMGNLRLTALLSLLDESEIDEQLEKYLAWATSYQKDAEG